MITNMLNNYSNTETKITSYLNDKINTIPQKHIRRRISLELAELISNLFINEYCFDIIINNSNSYNIIIYIPEKNKVYDFLMNNYPFYPPKIKINNLDEKHYLDIKSNYFRDALKLYKGIDCFCCSTLTCFRNWLPTKKIIDIIKQYEGFQNCCREISIIILVNIIKKKYLNTNINIIEWLFSNELNF